MRTILRGSMLLLALVAGSLAVYEQDMKHVGSGEGYELGKTIEEDPSAQPPVEYDIEGNVFDQRRVSEILRVNNGATWGTWGPVSYCPEDSYASGYKMRIEPKQGGKDDTALNGIMILCKNKRGSITHQSSSSVGPWGQWGGSVFCKDHTDGSPDYMTAFSLQVEKSQGLGDDTAANYARFKCRGLNQTNNHQYTLVKSPGHGFWGNWGSFSQSCAEGTAICGIKTRVDKKRWYHYLRDDTALNDAMFYCCY